MTASFLMRSSLVSGTSLLMMACDNGLEVRFAQPFPSEMTDIPVFPARHRAVYTAVDSGKSLCIGRTAVWRQELQQRVFSRSQLDSARRQLQVDSTYAEKDGTLHYLKWVSRDSVRDSWLWTDTIFTLTGSEPGGLRRFQGRYYLNTPAEDDEKWKVQRLEIDGSRLSWQTFTTDTLRLLALNPATVRYHREHGALTSFQIVPAPGQQTRRVGRYAGLWTTQEYYQRRR